MRKEGRILRFWFVRHGFRYYQEQPNIISWYKSAAEKSRNLGVFCSMRASDKVVYYSHESPKGIVGIFEVKSELGEKTIQGNRLSYYYDISPVFLANGGREPQPALMKRIIGYCLKPRGTIFELKPDEYKKIKSFLISN